MVSWRTKCLHFPTTLRNGTNTREDGKNFVSNTYSSNLDNQPLYCVYSSLSPSSMQRSVHTQFLSTFASLNWIEVIFCEGKVGLLRHFRIPTRVGVVVPVKSTWCDSCTVGERGTKKITWIENGNYKPNSMFFVVCSIGELFNLKEYLYECLIYSFCTQKRSEERKYKTPSIYFITKTH